MTRLVRGLAAGAALICPPVWSGQHHIWFDAPGAPQRSIIAACEDDGGQTCKIDLVDAGGKPVAMQQQPLSTQGIDLYPALPGTFRQVVQFSYAAGTRVRFSFRAGPVRIQDLQLSTPRAGSGTLVGFSTDASGIATTGSWRTSAPQPDALPSGFGWVGGGLHALQADTFIEQHQYRGFDTGTAITVQRQRAPAYHYMIGLRLDGLGQAPAGRVGETQSALDLAPLGVFHAPLTPTRGASRPTEATTSGGMAPSLPGGSTSGVSGLPATASAPLLAPAWYQCVLNGPPTSTNCPVQEAVGWYSQSRANLGQTPLTVATSLYTLPRELKITDAKGVVRSYRLEAAAVSGNGLAQAQPVAEIGGLRGQYAVTGAGADVAWQEAVSHDPRAPIPFLNRIEPRPDLGGASVAARPEGWAGNQVPAIGIIGFALGIRLVEQSTESKPALISTGLVDTLGFCLVEPRLKDSAVCNDPRRLLTPVDLCGKYGAVLRPMNYCTG